MQHTKPSDFKGSGLSESASSVMRAARDSSRSADSHAPSSGLDPRIVTRGSFSSNALKSKRNSKSSQKLDPHLEGLLEQFFFDWYQVTLPNPEGGAQCDVGGQEERDAITAAFSWARGQGLHPGKVCGGHNGYRAALPFVTSPESREVVLRLNSGSTSGVMPNLMLTGGHGACASLAPDLQRAFPAARLSRADAALDWSQAGLWDDLLAMARKLSASNSKLGGVRVIESDTGRTFYLGSRTSTVSLRVYEKDRERAAKGVISEEDIDPDLIRIEWTFRPQSKSKAGMAGLSPGQMIRSSVWARDFMSRAAQIMRVTSRVERIPPQEVVREVREKTLQGTVEHGVDQYGRSVIRLAAARIVERDHGGHYDTAVVGEPEVMREATRLLSEALKSTVVYDVLREERLHQAYDPDEWRASYVDELLKAPGVVEEANRRAQENLHRAARLVEMA